MPKSDTVIAQECSLARPLVFIIVSIIVSSVGASSETKAPVASSPTSRLHAVCHGIVEPASEVDEQLKQSLARWSPGSVKPTDLLGLLYELDGQVETSWMGVHIHQNELYFSHTSGAPTYKKQIMRKFLNSMLRSAVVKYNCSLPDVFLMVNVDSLMPPRKQVVKEGAQNCPHDAVGSALGALHSPLFFLCLNSLAAAMWRCYRSTSLLEANLPTARGGMDASSARGGGRPLLCSRDL
ncbi:hypothetical protein CYMTET_43491 [Cymbomonas tetramitiformis]|uniref:Uncharacterized protein n=1 Tax=Cymbomonas tetramitiformis TaxID=36881 RepID=A0AAE0C458_9CHLO|nr:hypothetical protein CYMTET_43491 [Cymbomonas tetramitiformis]